MFLFKIPDNPGCKVKPQVSTSGIRNDDLADFHPIWPGVRAPQLEAVIYFVITQIPEDSSSHLNQERLRHLNGFTR